MKRALSSNGAAFPAPYLWESHVDQVKPALQSLGNHHPAATWWTHGGQ